MTCAAPNRPILAYRLVAQFCGAARRAGRFLSPGQWLAVLVFAGTGVAAFGIAPDSTRDAPPGPLQSRALPLPELREVAIAGPLWREERVQRGDTIGSLLARAGVSDAASMAWLRTDPAARPLYQLRPGRPVRVAVDDDGRLSALRFLTGSGDMLAIVREGDAFAAAVAAPEVDIREAMGVGEIRSSLFAAADAAGLPDAVTLALADIFGGDIDFLQDLRRGDRFAVVYETRYVEGEPVGAGRILAAEFVNRGTTLRAFLWRHPDGEEGYYTENGGSSRKAFLRSPMEFSRMTSGYSLARFHPILQSWRAHRGVDYAAPTGTPVRATADGAVTFAGVQNGYGNVVVVQHRGAYSTLYAHLSRFAAGARAGARVRQGDTIGYVGATGWATGPHLHYEFRIAGDARNPLAVALPNASPIGPEQQSAFAAYVAPLLRQLAFAQGFAGSRLAAFE